MRPLTAKRILSSSWRPHEIRHAISCRVYIVSAGKWAIIVLAWPCAGWTFLQGLGAEGCCRHLLGCRHVRDLMGQAPAVAESARRRWQGTGPLQAPGASNAVRKTAAFLLLAGTASSPAVHRRQSSSSWTPCCSGCQRCPSPSCPWEPPSPTGRTAW